MSGAGAGASAGACACHCVRLRGTTARPAARTGAPSRRGRGLPRTRGQVAQLNLNRLLGLRCACVWYCRASLSAWRCLVTLGLRARANTHRARPKGDRSCVLHIPCTHRVIHAARRLGGATPRSSACASAHDSPATREPVAWLHSSARGWTQCRPPAAAGPPSPRPSPRTQPSSSPHRHPRPASVVLGWISGPISCPLPSALTAAVVSALV